MNAPAEKILLDLTTASFNGKEINVTMPTINNIRRLAVREVKCIFSGAPSATNDCVMFLRLVNVPNEPGRYQLHTNTNAKGDALPILLDLYNTTELRKTFDTPLAWYSWKNATLQNLNIEITNRVGTAYTTNLTRMIIVLDVYRSLK